MEVGIYKITSPNNRIYIGQTINFQKRIVSYKNENQNKSQIRLKYSFKKYGVENHIFEIIEKCDILLLNERERYWQDFYDVLSKKGLNCKLTKTNDKSGKHSKETCLKISLSNQGKKLSQETKNKISTFMKTRKISLETKLKISKANKGKKLSEKHKRKLSEIKTINITGNAGKKGTENKCSKKVLNIVTNQEWDSLTDCCNENSFSIKNMSRKLNGTRKNNTDYIYN